MTAMRKIQSVKTTSNKYSTVIYVNFDNGTFGTHSKDRDAKKWTDNHLNVEELAEAKKLALIDGKWTNYTAPREAEISNAGGDYRDEEDLDLEAQEEVRRQDAQQARKNQYQNQFEPAHGIEG